MHGRHALLCRAGGVSAPPGRFTSCAATVALRGPAIQPAGGRLGPGWDQTYGGGALALELLAVRAAEKTPLCRDFRKWRGPESNRRHHDFQERSLGSSSEPARNRKRGPVAGAGRGTGDAQRVTQNELVGLDPATAGCDPSQYRGAGAATVDERDGEATARCRERARAPARAPVLSKFLRSQAVSSGTSAAAR